VTEARPRYLLARTLHGVVLVAAVVGLSMELVRALTSDDVGTRLVRLFSYFTIQSNILAAVAAGMLLWQPDRRGRVFAVLRLDALLCIAVTGIVYHAVLSGLQDLTANHVAIAMAASTNVSSRLPNSIAPCMPSSPCGTYEASVHRGQVGQPSPDAVRRTAAPVTMMPMLATSDAHAHPRTNPVDGVRNLSSMSTPT
jgi:hypothetical protein